MKSKRIFSQEQAQEIVRLYEGGKLPHEIAQEFHCSKTTVREYLRRQGVELRPRGGVPRPWLDIPHHEFERARYLAVYEGLTTRQIAKRMGLSIGQVQYRLKKAGFRRSLSERSQHGAEVRRIKEALKQAA